MCEQRNAFGTKVMFVFHHPQQVCCLCSAHFFSSQDLDAVKSLLIHEWLRHSILEQRLSQREFSSRKTNEIQLGSRQSCLAHSCFQSQNSFSLDPRCQQQCAVSFTKLQKALILYFDAILQGAEFEVYETYAREQTASVSKQYRHLGIGGKLSELLLRTPVNEYFKV